MVATILVLRLFKAGLSFSYRTTHSLLKACTFWLIPGDHVKRPANEIIEIINGGLLFTNIDFFNLISGRMFNAELGLGLNFVQCIGWV